MFIFSLFVLGGLVHETNQWHELPRALHLNSPPPPPNSLETIILINSYS